MHNECLPPRKLSRDRFVCITAYDGFSLSPGSHRASQPLDLQCAYNPAVCCLPGGAEQMQRRSNRGNSEPARAAQCI